MNVLIVDDHRVVAQGVSGMIGAPFKVSHWADSGESSLIWLKDNACQIAVVDLKMPGMGGMELIKRLRRHFPHVAVVVFSAEVNGAVTRWLLDQNVRIILDKDCAADELHEALQSAATQRPFLSRRVAQEQLFNRNPLANLTEREYQVIRMLLDGFKQKQVAEQLFISHKTVSTYRQRAMDKLGLTTDLELAKFALEHGWIHSPHHKGGDSVHNSEHVGV